jgi:hypothetical protein
MQPACMEGAGGETPDTVYCVYTLDNLCILVFLQNIYIPK